MIQPIKAPVRPRVIVEGGRDAILLEDLVATVAESRRTSTIWLTSSATTGMTTALQHIAHLFSENSGLAFFDGFPGTYSFDQPKTGSIRFRDLAPKSDARPVKCRLTGWGRDEWIEYLLASHRGECASVMQRVQKDSEIDALRGDAFILRLVLDELAADERLPDVKSALRRIVDTRFPDARQRTAIASGILFSMTATLYSTRRSQRDMIRDLTSEQQRLRCIPAVRLLLAAEAAFEDLEVTFFEFQKVWPTNLLKAVAPKVAGSPLIQTMLQKWFRRRFHIHQPLAASVLHAAGIPWKCPKIKGILRRPNRLNLECAVLDGADCSSIPIARGSLKNASLEFARFEEADLRGTDSTEADFEGANLRRARMTSFNGSNCRFVGADLKEAGGKHVNFDGANFQNADLGSTNFMESDFTSTNLTEANFDRAVLRYCCFQGATLHGASFRRAKLDSADLAELDLSSTDFGGAAFRAAKLKNCNLEGMRLPKADFREADLDGALLTASVMPRAIFNNASLRNAGLADIQWEMADLRNADLTGATFHQGSSRNDPLDSSTSLFGSDTDFYTDEWNEQDLKAPEEIRRANLRGANIRGAIIDDVDFYLVDLRDALYDPEQEAQLQLSGAILATPSC